MCGLPTFAQYSGDGYYRLQNYMSERYAYVVNDKGKINIATSSADLSSVALYSDESKALGDPASVIYIKSVGDGKYNLIAQGTSLWDIMSHYLKIKDNGDGTYKAYAEQSGNVLYIGDAEQSDYYKGTLATNTRQRWRDWYVKPINNGTTSYLGVNPDIEVNGKYYKSYYASFPFSILSSGVKAYYVTMVSEKYAAYRQIESTKIAGGTPIYFECSSNDQSQNRLQPLDETVSAISGNLMHGVYFDFLSAAEEKRNQVTYDAATMRVLGKMSDGSLGFITAKNIETISANTCYIKVPATADSEIKLLTEDEYIAAGVNDIMVDNNTTFDIYTTTGVLVRHNATSTEGLPAGIYIVKGHKIVVLP